MCLNLAYLYSFTKIRIRYDCRVKKVQIESYLIYDLLSFMRNTIHNVLSRFLQAFRL